MSTLNQNATGISSKYIRKASSDHLPTKVKTRGLQAEINRLESVRKSIQKDNIERSELLRFLTELNRLTNITNELLDAKIAS